MDTDDQHQKKIEESTNSSEITAARQHAYREMHEASLIKHIFVLSIISAGFGIILMAIPEPITSFFYLGSSIGFDKWLDASARTTQFFGAVIAMLSTAGFAYLYTSGFNFSYGGSSKERETGSDPANTIRIISLLSAIDKSIEKGKLESVLSESERNQIINRISETVDVQLNADFLKRLEEKYGHQIQNHRLAENARSSADKTIVRLKESENALQSKANVNLTYGILSTIFGISCLVFLIWTVDVPDNATTLAQVFYYSSRAALVLLIEGISIFFLKLYKSTLADIRTLSNEITDAETRANALALSLLYGDTQTINTVLTSLSGSERILAQ